jgi:hypothetical protein
LRPFFRLKEGAKDILSSDSWEYSESERPSRPFRSCEPISTFPRTCCSNDIPPPHIDASTSDFPGILWNAEEKRLFGPRLDDEAHPHLKLETAMVSMPRVEPGDMVFWHCVSGFFVLFTFDVAEGNVNLGDL